MAIERDPYQVLGLSRGASLEDVKRAYRGLAKVNHPDAAGPAALPRFLAIQAAYEQIAGGGAARASGPRSPSRPSAADTGRAGATHRAYGARGRPQRPGTGPTSGGFAGTGWATEGRAGSAGRAAGGVRAPAARDRQAAQERRGRAAGRRGLVGRVRTGRPRMPRRVVRDRRLRALGRRRPTARARRLAAVSKPGPRTAPAVQEPVAPRLVRRPTVAARGLPPIPTPDTEPMRRRTPTRRPATTRRADPAAQLGPRRNPTPPEQSHLRLDLVRRRRRDALRTGLGWRELVRHDQRYVLDAQPEGVRRPPQARAGVPGASQAHEPRTGRGCDQRGTALERDEHNRVR